MSRSTILLATILFSSFSLVSRETSQFCYTQLDIEAVGNATGEQVTMQDNTERTVVAPPDAKNRALKKPFQIPFISIIDSLNEYKDSLDRAYIPKEALLVYLGAQKLFGIWQNEIGVMLSPDQKTNLDNHVQSKLMPAVNTRAAKNEKEIMSVLKLLLLIDKEGTISLTKI